MATREYYTLVASLPAIPYFERATRLSINEVRLMERMKMLEPEDAEIVQKTISFIGWHLQPLERTDRDIVRIYEEMLTISSGYPVLKNMISMIVDQRTILVALRRRHREMPVPGRNDVWGVGRLVDHIRGNWKHPDFRLGLEYPWIPKAREFIETDQALELERLLQKQNWKMMDSLMTEKPFSLEAILFYILKWGITKSWLSFNSEAALARFENYITEVIGNYEQHST
ncbi:MAG: DUF2764 family protein [Vulcanimicrobiota bacterium]